MTLTLFRDSKSKNLFSYNIDQGIIKSSNKGGIIVKRVDTQSNQKYEVALQSLWQYN